MITLETIRNKAGVLVSIIIGIALLAFIVNADTLSFAMSLFSSNNKNEVGKISGQGISYQEFDSKLNYNTAIYNLMYKVLAGKEAPMDEQVTTRLRDQTWGDFLQENIMDKQCKELGITVSDPELSYLMTSEKPSPMVAQYFGDQSGNVDPNLIRNVVSQLDTNPELKTFWIDLEDKTRNFEKNNKFNTLIEKSNFINSLEIKRMSEADKNDIQFSYTLKDYASIADSTIKVTDSDLKGYYNDHKYLYDQEEGRDIEYITIPVTPSAEDYEKTLEDVLKIQSEMAELSIEDLPQFVNLNSEKPFDSRYYKKGTLPGEIDSAAFSSPVGQILPFYQTGDTYHAARVVGFKMVPDSVRAEHILLDFQRGAEILTLADSLVNLIKGGAEFAPLAMQFSIDQAANMKGGDLDWFSYEKMVKPFSDSCFLKPKGTVMKVATEFGLHVVRITGTKNENRKVQIATIQETVVPGRQTYNIAFEQANRIAAGSGGNIQKFRELAAENSITVNMERGMSINAKNISSHTGVNELVRWAYDAKKGKISEVMEVDNRGTFVVAALTGIKEKGVSAFDEVKENVRVEVLKAKKAENISQNFKEIMASATNIDSFVEKAGGRVANTPSPVSFSSSYIPGMMSLESKLIGAATAAPENKLSGPVVGEAGVFMYVVTGKTEKTQNAEYQKMILKNKSTNPISVLMEKAEVVDNRGRFF